MEVKPVPEGFSHSDSVPGASTGTEIATMALAPLRGGMFIRMLEDDRRRADWSMGQVAWRLCVSIRECREIEAGERWPSGETFNRICERSAGRRRS